MQAWFIAACSGIATWCILNRHNVRGDVAAAFYCLASLCVYWFLRNIYTASNALSAFILLSSIYITSALSTTAIYRLSPSHPLASYPGPRHWWISSLWFSYICYTGRRHLILDELHARYGPFVRIGPNVLSVNSPSSGAATSHMEKSAAYLTPDHQRRVTLFFKPPSEKAHRDRKRIWSSLFSNSGVTELHLALEKRTWELLHTMERRQSERQDSSVDLADCINHWSYDFMGDMVFGGCNKLELMKNGDPQKLIYGGKMATLLMDSIGQSPWLMDLLWHLPLGKEMHRFESFAASMVHNRASASDLPPFRDLMSFLLDSGSVPMIDLEYEAIVAIQAGSDTPATAMVLTFLFLLCMPECYQRLREELDDTFPDPLGPLDHDRLAALPYLEGVINEGLRLGTPAFLPRIAPPGGITIDGKFIPGGTVVGLASYSQHTDPDNFFPDPSSFHPERWLPQGLGPDTKANKQAFWAFTAGPYVCVAKVLAYQEMRYAIARMFLAFDICLVDGFDSTAFRAGALNSRATFFQRQLSVHVKRRHGVDWAPHAV